MAYAAEIQLLNAATLELDTEALPSATCSEEEKPGKVIVEEFSHDVFGDLPSEILPQIFQHLGLSERVRAMQVCRQWRSILIEKSCPLLDVAVLNVFEHGLWEDSVSGTRVNRINVFFAKEARDFHHILRQLKSIDSLKIWYTSREFANFVLSACSQSPIKAKCIDLYPYEGLVALEEVAEQMQAVNGITIRPHGKNWYSNTIDLLWIPPLSQLHTLCIDSINITDLCSLPSSIHTLDYANRTMQKFDVFLDKLSDLKNLEFLSISHADLSSEDRLNSFLRSISRSNLPKLSFLFLKFCKMPQLIDCERDDEIELGLQFLKFDLTYGIQTPVVDYFIRLCRGRLANVSFNIIMEDCTTMTDIIGMGAKLKRAGIGLHMAVMQKSENLPSSSGQFVMPPPPASFFDVTARLEASFVNESSFFNAMLLQPDLKAMTEIKLIKCRGIDDELLEHVATTAVQLRRLTIINCDRCSKEGIKQFIENIHLRTTSMPLKILYKFGDDLEVLFNELLERKMDSIRLHHSTKTFPGLNSIKGQTISAADVNSKRTITIKNFSPEESFRIMGVVINHKTILNESAPDGTSGIS